MWRPLPFAIPCSPLLSFPGLASAGWPRDCGAERRAAPAAAPAVLGLGGQAAPAARGSGKMALPGSLPAFVAQFHPLSSPTGAILRSFPLSPRRVGRCRRAQLGPYFCVLSGKHFCFWLWEPRSPRNPQSLASLPYPPTPFLILGHRLEEPRLNGLGWHGPVRAASAPPTALTNLFSFPLKYVFLVIQRIGMKKKI